MQGRRPGFRRTRHRPQTTGPAGRDTRYLGGEFGKTDYCQGKHTKENYGRDPPPRLFTIWMAGGGVKPGVYGETDDFGYNIVRDPVHVHDFHATVLHLMELDHEKLTFKFQGRRYRLTDVAGKVVNGIIA